MYICLEVWSKIILTFTYLYMRRWNNQQTWDLSFFSLLYFLWVFSKLFLLYLLLYSGRWRRQGYKTLPTLMTSENQYYNYSNKMTTSTPQSCELSPRTHRERQHWMRLRSFLTLAIVTVALATSLGKQAIRFM